MAAVLRRCLTCRALVDASSIGRTGRCDPCSRAVVNEREANPIRRAVKSARYDAAHRRLRRQWAPHVAAGYVRCARARLGQCRHDSPFIRPSDDWALDHVPWGSHPSHADCNSAAPHLEARS